MKKFGFGKRSDDGGEDSSRSALFGSRSKNKSPAAPNNNPYAQPPPSTDPYSQPGSRPQAYGGMSQPGSYQNNPSKQAYGGSEKGYGSSNGGFAPGKQGNQGSYGQDRYGGGPPSNSGGYGGLGRADPNDPSMKDGNRDALFGNAPSRYQERQPSGAPPPYQSSSSYGGQQPGGNPAPGGPSGPSYGTYQDRQLTAEEEEEEDVQAIKQDIRFMKQQDVSSTRNALRLAAEAEESGRATLARLGAQGERIHNTEKNLDLAANQNRIAEEKARELKKVNGSMFAMHISNPFTSEQRRRARDQAIIDRHQDERQQREETRLAAFRTEQRMDQTFKEISRKGENGPKKTNLAERSKYQFEQDSEDDEMENEIESNLDAIHSAATRLNALAKATGREIDEQDPHIKRIIGKSDFVDDQIHMNRSRLDRIR
ncbi:transporter sec9 [Arthroderma uncinatum]|uniref:transporter sec9 n=1 Tax=Arthroderma uncinatum TaxID=74035 RepID=UPI00144A5D3A|nr:transporter sec9 [Arthroderma uncinatum]KAF3484039.1 transporter sec9 [Arthroderma uncinatum]